jgi:hypothetical protein
MTGREVTAADCRRWINALARNVRNGRVDQLAELAYLEVDLKIAMRNAVAGLRQHGITDGEIAGELGVTRQAVQRRWPENGRPTGAGARFLRVD